MPGVVASPSRIELIVLRSPQRGSRRGVFLRAVCAGATAGIAAGFLAMAVVAAAQNQTQPTPNPPQTPATNPLPRVTTTVEVHADTKDNYLPENVTAGTLDGAPLKETPLSATVVTRGLLSDQEARVLSDVVKNDASIGEDYAPVGYYGDFEIRGFPIDLATGLQINGMTVAGEQDVPLEDKERVEFLKGIAGVESGVASAGGLINFVTKRPAAIKAMDVATDHRGSAFGAVDFGRLFGREKQVGTRVNLAGERIASYVKDANGWRAMGAGAADWKISPAAMLKTDFEYQHKVERSVSGYQLLGGTTVPDLSRVSPATMLGEQSWSKPNTFDTFNTGARFDVDLTHRWHAFAQGSYSHSLIDDNVVYAYGTPFDDQGNVSCPGAPDAPFYFFCPDGSYAIYDYRNPGELRVNRVVEALVLGRARTGFVTHELAAGGSIFERSVQMPSTAVFDYVGSENIYDPVQPVPIESVNGAPNKAGPRVLYEDNHQAAAVLQDRMRLPGGFQLLAGGRFDSLRDHNYQAADAAGNSPVFTDKGIWLPQFAATYAGVRNLMLYGNYATVLSLGPQAPFWAGGYYLPPFLTRQAEVGAKYQPGQWILLTTALFRMRAPFFYPKTIDDVGDQSFVSEGHETHDGIEVNAEGKAANWLRLSASAAAIRAVSSDTGTAAFDNKQVINVPHVRTTVFADVVLPHAHGLHLMPGWGYTGRKEATRDDAVSVAGYNIFNLGARYTPGGEQGHMTLRLYADNITDKRYWKDTGASYGDTFVHLGAPTTVRMSAHYTF